MYDDSHLHLHDCETDYLGCRERLALLRMVLDVKADRVLNIRNDLFV